MNRSARALAVPLSLLAACGLINGLQGNSNSSYPAGSLASKSWHGPVQIDQGATIASDAPTLAWGQGAAWVAFYAWDPSSNSAKAWVTRRPRGGSFATPAELPYAPGFDGGVAYPQIAVGAASDAVVAMEAWNLNAQNDVGTSGIWATRVGSDLSLTQGGLKQVNLPGDANASLAVGQSGGSLAVDAAGNALLAYSPSTGAWISSQSPGGGWAEPYQLQSSTFEPGLAVAAGAAGQGVVAWTMLNSGSTPQTFTTLGASVSLSSAGLTAGPSQTVSTSESQFITAAMRGNQGMVLEGGEQQSSLYTLALSNGVWGTAQPLSNIAANAYVEPTLAINSSGQAVLLWQGAAAQASDDYAGTLQASFWNGTSWSPQQTISGNSPSPHAWWAKVSLNDSGEAVAAWADFDPTGTYTRIYANILETSSGTPVWSGPTAIDVSSPDAGLANQPQNVRWVGVALEPGGGVAQVIWMQHDPDTNATPRTWANWIE